MVLLRSEPVDGRPVLPWDRDALRQVAAVGRLADLPNTGDHGSSDVRAPEVVTFLQGLHAALPATDVVYTDGEDVQTAARLAADADTALVVVGHTADDEGEYVSSELFTDPELLELLPPASTAEGASEGPDQERNTGQTPLGGEAGIIGSFSTGGHDADDRLTLRPEDEELILAVTAANPRTVVGIVAAGPVLTGRWRDQAPSQLMLWYAGMEGGNALPDVLLGRCDAAGRLPFRSRVPRTTCRTSTGTHASLSTTSGTDSVS
ncbi:glycoside hydrolase family 3 protein [Streptomyces sp. NPDC021224]